MYPGLQNVTYLNGPRRVYSDYQRNVLYVLDYSHT